MMPEDWNQEDYEFWKDNRKAKNCEEDDDGNRPD